MPAGRRTPSNAMLVALIIFVGLFIAATTVAVIYYVQAEDYRTKAAVLQSQINELATDKELRKIGTIIGTKQRRKSRLGQMVDYLNEMVYLIIGGLPEDTSGEVKVDTAHRKANDILEMLALAYLDFENVDINTTGLIQIIEKLKTKLDNTTNAGAALRQLLDQLQNRFDDAMATSFEKEQKLLAEKEKYQQQVNDIKKDYEELEALLKQTSEQRVETLIVQRNEQRDKYEKEHRGLLKTQAQLKITEDKMRQTLQELQALVPPPDSEVPAYKPDGRIILIDNQAKIVHLDIGTDDHVYRGLTFAVYDKNMPIPRDGKSKADIEVFDVGKNISAARIIRSEIKNPIVLNDIIANLIWDSRQTNVFVVAGEFDLDDDGIIDIDGVDKINALIEKWGGKVGDTVSIETDFLVLGLSPKVLKKPSFEELEVDPMAMQKYEASKQRLNHYRQVLNQAQALRIPVFNLERFLYFIGYKTQATRAGAF